MTTDQRVAVDSARIAELTGREEERFRAGRRRSHRMWEDARRVLPLGVPSSFQDTPPQPVFVERAKGSRIWDVDGNEYVDFHNGFGVMIVGHAHPKIIDAVTRQVALGTHYAQPVAADAIVAAELARRFHQPKWRFTNSGTESTLDAVRLARGLLGRERIIKIEASYHGHHDSLMVSVEPGRELMGPREHPVAVPQSAGIPRAVVDLVTVVPFNDSDALEAAFARHVGEVAAVVMEPAMMNIGFVLPDDGYLERVRAVAHHHGALLVFDEVKTGLTLAAGGATERFGVVPDLVCLAKALGGGLPCGAIGGRDDVMAQIDEGRVKQMGTFNGNPLTMAAARATLLEILTPSAYAYLDALTEELTGGLEAVIEEFALPYHVIAMAARGCVTYRAERVRDYRDYLDIDRSLAYLCWLYQCNRGLLMAPGAEENWTLSVQHSVEDVQRYVDNFRTLAEDVTAR